PILVSMIADRGKEDFLHGSLQVFGNVSEKLYKSAMAILMVTDPEEPIKKSDDYISANEFAKLARDEIKFLQRQNQEFNSPVRVREDISGVMVNRGVLNISKEYRLTRKRAEALIQHEIGTHVVTYFNGRQQPLSIFSLGVPGYEELQEGLAVLAEYIVGCFLLERSRTITPWLIPHRSTLLGISYLSTSPIPDYY